ncbi:hypothetical protein B0O99DRAFT_506613 [Bisporella sp. PMI_857]|nr:hypothetical protein B0O99DRAFT_506613 [Bisporella sp. PMI_857]
MRPSLIVPGLCLITASLPSSNALKAITSSPCAVQCGNVLGSTTGDDLVCFDDSYGTSKGIVFQNCINCMISSNYVDPTGKQSDFQWALYNLRYAISWCLFGFPNNSAVGDTPCTTSTACGPIEGGLEFDGLNPNASTYAYCALVPEVNVPKCHSCLSNQDQQFYLTNMLTALNGACLQQPTPGKTISLDGTIFSKVAVNITDPTQTSVSVFNPQKGGLSLGAKVGIAVSAIVVFLITAGCCIIGFGRRRRRKALAQHQQRTGYSKWLVDQKRAESQPMDMSGAGESGPMFHDSPQSQRPLVQSHLWGQPSSAIEESSPASAFGEKAYFSPYSSQYSSPVSANDQVKVVGREWPTDRKGSLGGVVAGLGRSRSTDKRVLQEEEEAGDRIEMQNVPPVLLHPGNGRGRPRPGLTAVDVQKGTAI